MKTEKVKLMKTCYLILKILTLKSCTSTQLLIKTEEEKNCLLEKILRKGFSLIPLFAHPSMRRTRVHLVMLELDEGWSRCLAYGWECTACLPKPRTQTTKTTIQNTGSGPLLPICRIIQSLNTSDYVHDGVPWLCSGLI